MVLVYFYDPIELICGFSFRLLPPSGIVFVYFIYYYFLQVRENNELKWNDKEVNAST